MRCNDMSEEVADRSQRIVLSFQCRVVARHAMRYSRQVEVEEMSGVFREKKRTERSRWRNVNIYIYFILFLS